VTVRPVLRLPRPELAERAKPFERLDEEALALLDDLTDTMRAAGHSVGVAATQLGIARRAFVVDVSGHPKTKACHGLVELVNPELVWSDGSVVGREGCMSVPELTGDVARPGRLAVRGIGRDGTERVIETDAFEARAIAHELDHLDGLIFLDRLVASDRVFPRRTWR
jgi:peptide deformylase